MDIGPYYRNLAGVKVEGRCSHQMQLQGIFQEVHVKKAATVDWDGFHKTTLQI